MLKPKPQNVSRGFIRGLSLQNPPIRGPAGARRGWKLGQIADGGVPRAEGSRRWHLRRAFWRTLRRRALAGPPTCHNLADLETRRPTWFAGPSIARAICSLLSLCLWATAPGRTFILLTEERRSNRHLHAASVLALRLRLYHTTPGCCGTASERSKRGHIACANATALGSYQVIRVRTGGRMGSAGQVPEIRQVQR